MKDSFFKHLKIHKYPLKFEKEFELDLPVGWRYLSAQIQFGEYPVLWALVDTMETRTEKVKFHFLFTGEEMPDLAEYWYYHATLKTEADHMVWHLFEEPQEFSRDPFMRIHEEIVEERERESVAHE
jgi:hypothetical protein